MLHADPSFERVPGTLACFRKKEYDKTLYAECSYVSQRTLLKCNNVTPREILAKNKGICEEHKLQSQFIGKNYQEELLRYENDPSERLTYKPFNRYGNVVSEEDPALASTVSVSLDRSARNIISSLPANHPLKSAGAYTESDLIRMQLSEVEAAIESAQLLKKVTVEKQRRHLNDIMKARRNRMAHGDFVKLPIDSRSKELLIAVEHVVETDRRPVRLTKARKELLKPRRLCLYGNYRFESKTHTIPRTSEEDVRSVVVSLLNTVSQRIDFNLSEGCRGAALPGSPFCMQHVRFDARQKIFALCKLCREPAIDFADGLCNRHRSEKVVPKREFPKLSYHQPLSIAVPGLQQMPGPSGENSYLKKMLPRPSPMPSLIAKPLPYKSQQQQPPRPHIQIPTHFAATDEDSNSTPSPAAFQAGDQFRPLVQKRPSPKKKRTDQDPQYCARTRPFHPDNFNTKQPRAKPQPKQLPQKRTYTEMQQGSSNGGQPGEQRPQQHHPEPYAFEVMPGDNEIPPRYAAPYAPQQRPQPGKPPFDGQAVRLPGPPRQPGQAPPPGSSEFPSLSQNPPRPVQQPQYQGPMPKGAVIQRPPHQSLVYRNHPAGQAEGQFVPGGPPTGQPRFQQYRVLSANQLQQQQRYPVEQRRPIYLAAQDPNAPPQRVIEMLVPGMREAHPSPPFQPDGADRLQQQQQQQMLGPSSQPLPGQPRPQPNYVHLSMPQNNSPMPISRPLSTGRQQFVQIPLPIPPHRLMAAAAQPAPVPRLPSPLLEPGPSTSDEGPIPAHPSMAMTEVTDASTRPRISPVAPEHPAEIRGPENMDCDDAPIISPPTVTKEAPPTPPNPLDMLACTALSQVAQTDAAEQQDGASPDHSPEV
ncbi:unnamed protein product, partial [Mesorhabditis spiculigera]